MKAHALILVALLATAFVAAPVAHAQSVRQVVDVKPADDPNANDRAKQADMIKNGPSCPLINGSNVNRDANSAAVSNDSSVGRDTSSTVH